MTATFSTIRSAIKSLIQTDPDFVPNNGNVYDYEPDVQTINKDPFIAVIETENDSMFANTTENRREYIFNVKVFVERASRGSENAEILITDIVDRLIDLFDSSGTLGVNGVVLVKASPSSWSYEMGDKEYRVAEIKVGVLVWYDTVN